MANGESGTSEKTMLIRKAEAQQTAPPSAVVVQIILGYIIGGLIVAYGVYSFVEGKVDLKGAALIVVVGMAIGFIDNLSRALHALIPFLGRNSNGGKTDV